MLTTLDFMVEMDKASAEKSFSVEANEFWWGLEVLKKASENDIIS